jgi:hypothetical protein
MELKVRESLLPSNPTGARFCRYFHYGWDLISAPIPTPGKANWTNIYSESPADLRIIWREYCNPAVLLGMRFSESTNYAMVDIDRDSDYHPYNDEAGFTDLVAALESIGLTRYLLIRSSQSEGLHIYFFLPKKINSFSLSCSIKYALEDAGIYLKSGNVEIFPNPKKYNPNKPSQYNGHRLPLQNGSFILESKEFYPTSDSLEYFLELADKDAAGQDIDLLESTLAPAKKRICKERFSKGSLGSSLDSNELSKKAQEMLDDLNTIIEEGWTASGQTNDMLREIGKRTVIYEKLSDEAYQAANNSNINPLIKQLAERMVEVATNLPGYKEYCNHQHEINERCLQWANCLYGYYLPYRSFPERYRNFEEMNKQGRNNIVDFGGREENKNDKRSEDSRNKIVRAVEFLEQNNELPLEVAARAKIICATSKKIERQGVSIKTLYKKKNLALWHPEYRQSGAEDPKEEHKVQNSQNKGNTEDSEIPDPWSDDPHERWEINYTQGDLASAPHQNEVSCPTAKNSVKSPQRKDFSRNNQNYFPPYANEGGWANSEEAVSSQPYAPTSREPSTKHSDDNTSASPVMGSERSKRSDLPQHKNYGCGDLNEGDFNQDSDDDISEAEAELNETDSELEDTASEALCPGLRAKTMFGESGLIHSIEEDKVWLFLDKPDPLLGWIRSVNRQFVEIEF